MNLGGPGSAFDGRITAVVVFSEVPRTESRLAPEEAAEVGGVVEADPGRDLANRQVGADEQPLGLARPGLAQQGGGGAPGGGPDGLREVAGGDAEEAGTSSYGQPVGRGPPGEPYELPGDPPDTVGAEELANAQDAVIASRTAAACGPS